MSWSFLVWKPVTLLKRDSNTGAYCENSEIFKNTYFEERLQMTPSATFMM